MQREDSGRAGGSAALGAGLWALGTTIAIPAGFWLVILADPEERWLRMSFPLMLFLAQHGALAAAGRNRRFLAPVGLSVGYVASFVAFGLLGRDADPWTVLVVWSTIFASAWAITLSRSRLDAVLWFVVGAVAMGGGLWFQREVAPWVRETFESREIRATVRALAYSVVVAVVTTPLAWRLCRGAPRDRGARPPPLPEVPRPGRLLFGRIALAVAGLYAVVLGAAVLVGALSRPAAESAGEFPGNAVDLGTWNLAIGAALVAVGAGLAFRMNLARYAFHLVAPLGALALASVFPEKYWEDDLPWTMLLGLPFGALALLIGRRAAIAAATVRSDGTAAPGNWIRRGVPVALGVLAVAFVAYLLAQDSRPERFRSFAERLSGLNDYVKRMAVTHLFLWHAIPGALGATMPFFRRAGRGARE